MSTSSDTSSSGAGTVGADGARGGTVAHGGSAAHPGVASVGGRARASLAGAARDLGGFVRRRRTLQWPITLSIVLMALNVALMVCWIVLLAQIGSWSALTIGTVVFSLILVGLSVYLALIVREVRFNQRQANFVDSVTHELKSPLAALRLYLETLQLRELEPGQRAEFYRVMDGELRRLDELISHLLEVGRLDAIGHQGEPEDVPLAPLLKGLAETACRNHHREPAETVTIDAEPAVIHARRLVLEMVFGNLFDNALKYGGSPPQVHVEVRVRDRGRVAVRIADNGEGVPRDQRQQIFRIFHRGGNELERRQKGTGLGLYIVRTLVHMLGGKVGVTDRADGPGSVFEVVIPGRTE
jgi:signal transduction histidine kinase